ncbi:MULTISPECIES: 3-hydroxyacyl-CoA dehydrogenase family protein [Bordetella]|uniref:3-hydroxyacyl-CoA dehydrogenase n=4 Tax=Bordetella TaxID=517 RepID=A0ABX4FCL1_9BORD|nr:MULTISPECIES: 3-hydroxyacyl-CoA dehydrogenase NAD-binding domain-containing protein [Bordetella]AOB27170.1 3-hydroxyacyl-CoA dehydrogenase [Bordetella bronchiseptica]AWP75493.1 3-hydroxyacyl-CoA dehydrogenase [Bordetella bronchiseptica]AZW44483.1 3-hydroxyacyl-CoA dehydrogenase [Bordetella bronchiseptica]KCV67129.1 putative 3-hydroxybutyryl-CoA dehydrogenase [Bordetella bronchiseptica 99-R-0433]KDC01036.1 putative 3-hydroxybutyryl-CoA dehydrogenase [Bordetella bronchiseptica D993]
MSSPDSALGRPGASHAVVIGGGTMGADVAVVLARALCRTTVVEPDAGRAAALPRRAADNLAQAGRAEGAAHITVVASLDAVEWDSVGLVIECVPERLDIKQALFAELARRAPAHAILASNSSSFPISAIGAGLPTRERMLGLHFFMPAHLVPLVEVVLCEASDPARADVLIAFMRRCGMVPVKVAQDLPGFLANRLQHALSREAFDLIDRGIASPEDVDAAVRFGFGFRFLAAGPVMQRDHAGIDVHAAAGATMYPTFCNADTPARCLTERAADGRHGMKAGTGFYAWTPDTIAAERARYDRLLRAGLDLLAAELPEIQP